jgi:hypothetical protein
MGSSSYLSILYIAILCWECEEELWQERIERILDLNFLIHERKKKYTFKKEENMKWPLATIIFWKFLGMNEPVFP